MKRKIIKLFYFLRSRSYVRYIILFLLIAAFFVGLGFLLVYFFNENIIATVLATAFGFAVSNIVIFFAGVFSRIFEDNLKVNTSTEEMMKIYKRPEYQKIITFGNKSMPVCYKCVLIHQDNYTYEIDDNPDKFFQLEGFVEENYNTLFELHSSSSKENTLTIRMDDFYKKSDNHFIFSLSRSNFYNHLVTNRAVDFEIIKDLSLRSLYEPGPTISPLSESKFSNHIGVNALVFTNDNHIIFPQRKKNSTISKNCITSSIATRLLFPNNSKSIDAQYVLHDQVLEALEKRLSLDLSLFKEDDIEIEFLGFGQNVYEGGKPQMYFTVRLKTIDLTNYKQYLRRLKTNESKIDNDKCLYLAKYDSISIARDNSKLCFDYYDNDKKKYRHHKAKCEKSLICNIWHYQQTQKKNLVMFDCFGVMSSSVLPPWFKKQFGEEEGKKLSDYYCNEGDDGKLSLDEIASLVSEKCNIKPKKLIKTWIKSAKKNEELAKYINELKKNNEVILASNACNGLVEKVLKKFKLRFFFDRVFISYFMKSKKPQKEYFEKILASYSRPFEKIVMVDDSPKNLQHLKELGITGIVYKNVPELKEELNKII